MPAHEQYTADQGEAQTGASSLLSLIGQSKHVTGGFPIFAIKAMLVSFSSATVFGCASYMLFHGPLGPALSFLCGSSFGFVGGCVHRWRTDRTEALQVVRHYPRLLEHHLRLCGEAKHEFERQSFAQWSKDIGSNPRKQGLAIVAMYAAAPALERIQSEQEEAIVMAYASGAAEEGGDSL